MQSTQRLRPVTWLEPNRAPWLMLLGMMIAALVAFDIAFVMLPDFSRALFAAWNSLTLAAHSGRWLSLALAVGVASGGAALGFGMSVMFVRGVQAAPYVWITPVLISFSSVVLARMQVTLPLPISAQSYALASGFFMLGGGALMQTGRRAHLFVGPLVIALPLGLLAGSFLSPTAGDLGVLHAETKLFFFVLTASTLGVALVAVLTPSAPELFGRAQLVHEHERQLAELLARARDSEQRAHAAEQHALTVQHSLRIQGEELEAALAIQDDAALLVGRRGATWRAWLLAGAVLSSLALMAVGYFMLYQPLVQRVQAQSSAIALAKSERASQLATLQTQWKAERESLRDQVTRAQTEASTAAANALQQKAAYEAQLAAAATTALEATKEAPKAPVKARPTAHARSKAAHTTRVAPKRAAKPASSSDVSSSSSKRGAAGVAVSDDPIAGLDGM